MPLVKITIQKAGRKGFGEINTINGIQILGFTQ